MNNPWNIPDWRDRDSYADHMNFPLHLWRWEFLRRSSQYRADWNQFDCQQKLIKLFFHGRETGENTSLRRRVLKANADPSFSWGRDKMGLTGEERIAFCYGLFDMLSPSLLSTEVNQSVFFESDHYLTEDSFKAAQTAYFSKAIGKVVARLPGEKQRGRLGMRANSMHSFTARVDARGKTLVSIDPSQPLEPQLKAIRKQIEKKSAPLRIRADQFELALRLIDARSEDREPKPTWKEITAVISKEKGLGHLTPETLLRKHRTALQHQSRLIKPLNPLPSE